jgi:hypothetical protein
MILKIRPDYETGAFSLSSETRLLMNELIRFLRIFFSILMFFGDVAVKMLMLS